MTAELSSLRYELKMVSERQLLYEVRKWIRTHSWAFRRSYPSRQVNNIYFDTLDMDCLNDHLSGVSDRRKLRFRWYGEGCNAVNGSLELKQKSACVCQKIIQPIDATVNLETMQWEQIFAVLARHSNNMFRELLGVSRPVLINSYQREYYEAANEQTRLTLDYNLVAYDQHFYRKPNLIYRKPLLDLVIIEVKNDTQNSDHLANVLAEFPLRFGRYSKYAESVNGLSGCYE